MAEPKQTKEKPELTPEERLTKDLKLVAAKARSINTAVKDFGQSRNLRRLALKVELSYEELSDAVGALSVTLRTLSGK